MSRVIRQATPEDLSWAAQRIGLEGFCGDAKGIAMVRDGQLAAVAVYDSWGKVGCYVHIASDGTRRWATPEYLLELFAYPFITARLRRLTAMIHEKNEDSMRLCKHMGFKVEGLCEEAAPDGGSMFIMGLTRRNCRFIPPEWRQ